MKEKNDTTQTVMKNQEIEQIYKEYKDKVSAYVYGKIANKQDVEDVVSSVFFHVVNRYDTYDSQKASISTWIYTITHNLVIDYYRKQKTYLEYTDYSGVSWEEMTTGGTGQEELLDCLADALEELKIKERDLIILHYYEGYKLKEIAEIMQMSYVNAKVIHRKALDRMREVIPLG